MVQALKTAKAAFIERGEWDSKDPASAAAPPPKS
jgi:hypothetical protein